MGLARTLFSAVFLSSLAVGVFCVALAVALVQREAASLPAAVLDVGDYRPAVTSTLRAADGSLMERFAEQDRRLVALSEVPPLVVAAFLSAEDRNFWQHQGIDPLAIARAVVTNIKNRGSGRRAIGASTITQQVVKNLLVGDEASLRRKIREALLSLRVERELGKHRILELYLNEIYLGEGAYGVAAAAETYFGKPLAALDVAEAAFLAGLPKAPGNYHPVRHAAEATARRGYVLARMVEDGIVSPEQAAVAARAPLPRPAPKGTGGAAGGYFAEEVRREIVQRFGAAALYRGGLEIGASMDPALQAAAEKALRDGLVAYDRRQGWRGPIARLAAGTDLARPQSWARALAAIEVPAGAGEWRLAVVLASAEDATIGFADGTLGLLPHAMLAWAKVDGRAPRRAADVVAPGDVVLVEASGAPGRYELRQIPEVDGSLVAMEIRTGRVVAIVGGFSHERSSFNRATQAKRQPGSVFKPFVYLAALENGYEPTSPLLDAPISIEQGPGLARWRPENYGGGAGGLITLRQALEKSKNLSTVRLLYEIGLEPVAEVARRFGLYDDLPTFAAALGVVETTPLRMTAAYAALANGGHRVEPSFIDKAVAADGTVLMQREAGARAERSDDQARRGPLADPVLLAQMTSMLEGVVQRGTAASLAKLGLPLAGKTGTTNESRDAWFVGYSPDLAVGVHIGFDRPRSLGLKETGGNVAAPIFGGFMKAALAIRPPSATSFPLPEGARIVRLDPTSGAPSPSGIDEVVREP